MEEYGVSVVFLVVLTRAEVPKLLHLAPSLKILL
jgi:hypothetical protein